MKVKIQAFYDLTTTTKGITKAVVACGGRMVMQRLAGFFAQYKYFKLGPIKAKIVAASTLPVDPTKLTINAGDPGVDPADQCTPGLIRITNGEVVENLDTGALPSGDTDKYIRNTYYAMILDSRWWKWPLQSGVTRTAIPLYWKVGNLRQEAYPGTVVNYPYNNTKYDETISKYTNFEINDTSAEFQVKAKGGPIITQQTGSDPGGLFQTGRARLGWLTTDNFTQTYWNDSTQTPYRRMGRMSNVPPNIEVITILLPWAHHTMYYFRVFVTETIYFKGLVTMNSYGQSKGNVPSEEAGDTNFYTPLDRGIRVGEPVTVKLTHYDDIPKRKPEHANDGSGV